MPGKKRVANKGFVPQYYVEGCHEPIIPRELYLQVQEEMVRRARLQTGTGKRRVYSGKYALSSKVYCGNCGDLYQRTHWDIRGRKEVVWRCVSRLRKSEVDCPARTVKEEELHTAVVQAVNELIAEKDGLLPKLAEAIEQGLTEKNKEKIVELEKKLETLEKALIEKANAGDDCEDLTKEIDILQDEKQALLLQDAEDQGLRQRMKEIVGFLEQQETAVAEYDEDLVRKLIQKITVYDDRCDVTFKSGIITEVYV